MDDLVGITGLEEVEYETLCCTLLPPPVVLGVPLVGLVGVLLPAGDVGDVAVLVELVVVMVVLVAVAVVTVGLVVLETRGFGMSVTD